MITAVAAGGSLWLIRVALASMLATLLGTGGANAGIAQRVPTPVPTPTPRPPLAPVPVGTFDTRQFSDATGNSMTYYLYAPATYTPSGHYPLVLVLHGGGEVADPQATAQHNHDVLVNQPYVQAFTAAQVQQKWPSFVVAPQVPAGSRWVNVPATVSSYTLAPQPSRSLTLAFEIVQSLEQTYPMIDPNRIYVEGISMGGFGTWEAAERWPTTFAAAMPISGAGDPHAAGALVHVPIWAFHGALDDVVPVQASRLMVQAIQADGGAPCYTEYADVGHGIWDNQYVFGDQQVYAWLFSQTRAPSATAIPLGCPTPSG